jgi:hypothetical protein
MSLYTPFAFVKQEAAGAALNPVVTAWNVSASIADTSLLQIVSTFVDTMQTAGIWSKMTAVYPMVTDSTVSATAKTTFSYNLVDPTLYTAEYVGTVHTGSKSGLKFGASNGAFRPPISPNSLGSNYMMGIYTATTASANDEIDAGLYDGGSEYVYVVCGRNASGGNAGMLFAASGFPFTYNATTSGPHTGLFSIGGNSSTAYAYGRSTQLGTNTYTAANRGDNNNFGLGCFLQTNTTVISPSSKTYQFYYLSQYLTISEATTLYDAVDDMQASIDTLYGTSRLAT